MTHVICADRFQTLKGCYVNIVDFLAAKRAGKTPNHFRTFRQLQQYIVNNPSKRFPLKKAKDSVFLTALLISVG